MTDDQEKLTKEESLSKLRDLKGQAYILPSRAHALLQPFVPHVTDEYLEEYDVEDFSSLVYAEAIADAVVMARDARGIPTVHAYQNILTASDASEILVESIGEEASTYTAGGAGFTADGRHRENVETAIEALDVDLDDEDDEE